MSIFYINPSGSRRTIRSFETLNVPLFRFWKCITGPFAKIAAQRAVSAANAGFRGIDDRTLRDLGFEQPQMLWARIHVDSQRRGAPAAPGNCNAKKPRNGAW